MSEVTEQPVQNEELPAAIQTAVQEVETVTQATTQETEQAPEGEKTEQTKSQGSKQRLKRKLRLESERATRAEEETRTLREQLTTLETKVDGIANPPPPRPDRVNFETEEEYEDALHAHFSPAKPVVQEQTVQSQPVQQQRAGIDPVVQENWDMHMDKGHDKYDDFIKVINNPNAAITPTMESVIMGSEQGADIAYLFGQHPEKSMEIARMDAASQVRAIDELAKNFISTTTSAPDPLNPIRSGDEGVREIEDPVLEGCTFT